MSKSKIYSVLVIRRNPRNLCWCGVFIMGVLMNYGIWS